MPPLQKRVLDVPFAMGPDDKINPHLRDAAQLSLLEHCYQEKTGMVRKRNGLAEHGKAIDAGGNLSAVVGLHEHNGQLLAHDGDELYGWSPSNSKWHSYGVAPPAAIAARAVAFSTDDDAHVQIAGYGNYLCYVRSTKAVGSSYNYDKELYTTLVDTDSRIELMSNALVVSGSSAGYMFGVAAVSANNAFALVHRDFTSGNIKASMLTSVNSNPTLAAVGTNIRTDAGPDFVFDVVELGTGEFAVVYDQTATGDLVVVSFNSSLVQQNIYTYTPAGTVSGVHAHWDSVNSKLVVGFWDGATLKVVSLSASLVADYSPATVETIGASYTPQVLNFAVVNDSVVSTSHKLFYSVTHDDSFEHYIDTATVTNAGVVTTGSAVKLNLLLVAKPFAYNGDIYMWGHRKDPMAGIPMANPTESKDQGIGSLVCVRDSDSAFVARALVGQHQSGTGRAAAGTSRGSLDMRDSVELSTGVVSAPFFRAERSALDFSGSDRKYDGTLVDLEIDLNPASSPSVSVGDGMLLGAGMLRVYDGNAIYVAGIVMNHPNFDLTTTAAGGSLTDGDYGVAIVYRWTDGNGREYYSVPTLETITLGGGGSAQSLEITRAGSPDRLYYNALTDKRSGGLGGPTSAGIDILAFRTAVNGSVHYFIRRWKNDEGNFLHSSDLDIDSSDAGISDNATLYTTGGALSFVLPPTPHHIAADETTAALVPGDKRDTIWVSAPIVLGEGVRFTDDLVYDVPEGGDIEAVWFMDGRLIVFKNRQIRYMVGSAPNSLGQFGYEGSELITSDVGCEDWRSVVRIPDGILFKSEKGFYILRRDFQVQYIGSAVESYNSETVESAVVLAKLNQVRFCMSGGDVVVYDYFHGNWPRFPSMSLVASAVWDGAWVVAKSDATMGKENSSVWDDYGSTSITMKIRTGWLRLAALQGFQRVRRIVLLGQSADIAGSDDLVTVKSYVNFDENTAEETLVNGASMGATQDVPVEERITLGTQKMTALMIEISVISDADDESMTLTGVSFECAAKKGAPRLAAANTR